MRRLLALVWLLVAAPAAAQTSFLVYPNDQSDPSTTQPIWSTQVATSAITCGQPKSTAASQPGVIDGSALRLAWDDPSDATKDCDGPDLGPTFFTSPLPPCFAAPCTVYRVFVQLVATDATTRSARPVLLARIPDPRCAAPLGDRTVTIFITDWQATTGNGGALARVNGQFSSPNSPLTSVNVRLNGKVARAVTGTDLTGLTGMWFAEPTTLGTYVLDVQAVNAYGCSAVQALDATGRPMSVVVK